MWFKFTAFFALLCVGFVVEGQKGKGQRGPKKVLPERPQMKKEPPGQMRRELAQAKVKVKGKPIQFFTDEMILDLQTALHKLAVCEAKTNPHVKPVPIEETEFLIDDDVLPRLEVVNKWIEHCENKQSAREKRQLWPHFTLWPTDKPVKIMFTDEAKNNSLVVGFFETLAKDVSRKTCLDLQLVDERPNEPYILVVTDLVNVSGCFTYLGMNNNGRANVYLTDEYDDVNANPIFLLTSGCHWYDIVAHEFMHVLGFFHEQSRPDRDQYITINWDYIPAEQQSQFIDCSVYDCQLVNKYDPISLLHYHRTGFSINSSLYYTIEPKNPKWDHLVGAAADFSTTDWLRINEVYCSASCGSTVDCGSDSAYPNPNNCSQCLCPDGIGEGSCDNAQPDFDCGSLLEATPEWQSIVLPYDIQHPRPNHCTHVIQAPNDLKVEVATFNSTSISQDWSLQPCIHINFEVRTSNFGTAETTQCGDISHRNWVSNGNRLMTIFRFNWWKNISDIYGNFTFYYRSVPADYTTTTIYYNHEILQDLQDTTTTTTNPAGPCDPDYFYCESGIHKKSKRRPGRDGNCIPNSWLCEPEVWTDCADGADEQNC